MKKLLLLLVFMPCFMASCSSDDEDVEFVTSDINLIPQATRVNKFGKYQIHHAELNVNEQGVTCVWKYSSANDEGFTSEEKSLEWWPTSTGTYTITATLSKSGKTKTISKQCEVVECSGGFGFIYQPTNEIMANETMYSVYYYQSMPEVDYNIEKIGSKSYNVWRFKDSGKRLYRKYYFDEEGLHNVVHIPF